MKESPDVAIADAYADASILFADMAGFTARASKMTAPELVQFLNGVCAQIDNLVERHGLEKIKTTGDDLGRFLFVRDAIRFRSGGGLVQAAPTTKKEGVLGSYRSGLNHRQTIGESQSFSEPVRVWPTKAWLNPESSVYFRLIKTLVTATCGRRRQEAYEPGGL